MENARMQISNVIHSNIDEIIFMSGGTETINYVIKGVFLYAKEMNWGNRIIISCVEHVAVIETCKYLKENYDADIVILDVNSEGIVPIEAVKNALTSNTILVSIMTVNNEVGAIQPIHEISNVIHEYKTNHPILFHSDASQAIGKIPVDVNNLGVDYLTIAGHKIYAPKGVGALYIRNNTPKLPKLIHGALNQENNIRSGTENIPYIVGLGKACEIIVYKY